MRMLLRASIPVEAGNAAVKAGTLGSTIERIMADLKPEAAYFIADDNGQRSASIVFDLQDTSQIPAVAEPWFLAFNAHVSIRPVMNAQDLAKAGPSFPKMVQQYGGVSPQIGKNGDGLTRLSLLSPLLPTTVSANIRTVVIGSDCRRPGEQTKHSPLMSGSEFPKRWVLFVCPAQPQ